MTEKDKRDQGQLYDPNHDAELQKEMEAAGDLCFELNQTPPSQREKRQEILSGLLGSCGADCVILSPFWCDYGYNIQMGRECCFNHNCVILDGASVTFGSHVFVGPDCGFYTAGHPLDVKRRSEGQEYARPIRVGDHVWIGGGVRVLPGVTIGDKSVIGAGSVVTEDIPSGVLAAGNPCRVIRELNEEETRVPGDLTGNPRKPEGEDGAKMLSRMNKSHEPVTEWALDFLRTDQAESLLDIGCGGGATIKRLADRVPEGKVTGVDYSAVSVQESQAFNEDLIQEGRVEVVEASVEDLPFEDGTFDRITTVESFYFWPDPAENLKEVHRILKKGGQFLLIADIYGKAGLDPETLKNIELYDLFNPSKEEFIILFRNAGFTAVKIHVKDGTDWICVEGLK